MAGTFCLERCWDMVSELITGSVPQNNFEDRGYFVAGKKHAIFICGDDEIELKGFAGYGQSLVLKAS